MIAKELIGIGEIHRFEGYTAYLLGYKSFWFPPCPPQAWVVRHDTLPQLPDTWKSSPPTCTMMEIQ